MNRPRDAEPLGRGAVDPPVQADDAAEGADRVAVVGQLEGLGQAARPTAAPQGLLCLRIEAAGSANWRTRRRALSRSSRLLYDSSLPCSDRGGREVRPGASRLDVERGLLVRVLAVSQDRPALEPWRSVREGRRLGRLRRVRPDAPPR